MKINKQKPKKYKLYISIVILVILIAGAIYYGLNISNNKKDNSTNNSPISVKEESQPKKQEISNSELIKNKEEKITNSDTPPKPVQNKKENPTYTVSMFTSYEYIGKNIEIRGEISNLSIDQGSCKITLNGPNNQIITKNTELLPSPQTTSCRTTLIDTSNMNKGNWIYKLSFDQNNIHGETNEIKFEVK